MTRNMRQTKIKICGITESRGLEAAVTHGADFVGFVFHGSSSRCVTPAQVQRLTTQIPESVLKVGLFVDPDEAALDAVLSQVTLNLIQLHGNESPERVSAVKSHTSLPVIKALRIASKIDLNQASLFDDSADWMMFDAKSKIEGQFGGTGHTFDWSILEGQKVSKPWMLAGGLTPGNVVEAVTRLRPTAVDVSSGVEREPGIKDPDKIAAFIKAVRQA